ncbi:MAG TPA: response regulator, partial [Polyangiales bacterium]
ARGELLEGVFRAAHSLKGAARAVHVSAIETICHRLEHALSELRTQPSSVDAKTVQALLVMVDGVKAAANRLRAESAAQAAPARGESHVSAPAPHAIAQPANHNAAHVDPRASRAPPHEPAQLRAPEPRAPEPRAARVATHKLDALVASSGDLVVASTRVEAQLEQLSSWRDRVSRVARAVRGGRCEELASMFLELERELDTIDTGLRREVGEFSGASRRVDDEVRRLRMVPFREACEGLERAARDLAQALDKESTLVIEGDHVELDRELVQRLRDPLLHLVRNAVSHGIEAPAQRSAKGKPRTGTVAIRSSLCGALVELTVEDDGGGLDLAGIRTRARALGLPDVSDEEELAAYVFAPGLSTSSTVDEISGRGVGLDAVKRSVEALHGTVSVGRGQSGTRFVLRLPVTLSKLRALSLRVAGEHYVVPTSHVLRVLRFQGEQILHVGGRELVRAESELVPLVSCAALLGLPTARTDQQRAQALVVVNAGRSVALVVDELLGERECIVHKLPRRVAGSEYVSGATVLARGRVALVLNGSELARAALADVALAHQTLFTPQHTHKQRVLVVDDSITTRALIKSIVEEGGYDVTAARDGVEALKLLTEQPFDLVVSDVQMPHLDGFGLTEEIRKNEKLSRTPVVLVTSLEGESDRLRGLEAGANAYLGKSAFDHRVLIEALRGLT